MEQLLKRLTQGGVTVITATQRLARHLVGRYGAYQQMQGARVWESPDVIPWSGWISRTWATRVDRLGGAQQVPLLLSDAQELVLWEQTIDAAVAGKEDLIMLPVATTGTAVRDAWRALHGWRRTPEHCRRPLSEDATAFVSWAREFRCRCQDNGWIDNTLAAASLIDDPVALADLVSTELILLGFDELTPQQHALVEACKAAGIPCTTVTPQVPHSKAVRIAVADSQQEYELAARWVRALLEAGHPGPIGVAVKGLEVCYRPLERVFQHMLCTGPVLSQAGRRVFDITAGQTLDHVPVIAAAMRLLRLAGGETSLADIGSVLCSPFLFGAEGELTQRALLDRKLRREGVRRLGLHRLRDLAGAPGLGAAGACPQLIEILNRALALLPQPNATLPAGEWARFFADWLKSLGWPGERPPDGIQSQALNAWHRLLSEFASLGLVLGRASMAAALSRCAHMARLRQLPPQAPLAPVQILDISSVSGLTFSHLWVAGLSDQTWPEASRPTPFLPISLQQDCDMPHASAARQLQRAHSITQRLLDSAQEIVVSTSRIDEDFGVRPSPLITAIREVHPESLELSQTKTPLQIVCAQRTTLAPLVDTTAPPYTDSQSGGGVSIFRDQAICPFRAFARHRLGAAELVLLEPGLDAAERGKIVHRALELVWRELGSQHQLAQLSGTQTEELVARHVRQALAAATTGDGTRFSRRFLALERRRLTTLILKCLQRDLDRPAFDVETQEAQALATIAGLQIRLRPDRVDRLTDGSRLVIDYKTGDAKPRDWFGERPTEPQLPLYLLALGKDVTALAFSIVRRGNSGYSGVAKTAGVAPGITTLTASTPAGAANCWDSQVSDWRQVTQRLASNYRDGRAEVDPKPRSVCRYCDIHPLCRVFETRTVADGNSVAANGDVVESGDELTEF